MTFKNSTPAGIESFMIFALVERINLKIHQHDRDYIFEYKPSIKLNCESFDVLHKGNQWQYLIDIKKYQEYKGLLMELDNQDD